MPPAAVRHFSRQKRIRRNQPLDGVYIAAQIPSHEMQRLYREEMTFTLGDGLVSYLFLLPKFRILDVKHEFNFCKKYLKMDNNHRNMTATSISRWTRRCHATIWCPEHLRAKTVGDAGNIR